MRKIPVYLTALCLTLGAAAAFAAPKAQPKTPAQTTKAGTHHHHHHHKTAKPAAATKKG